MNIRPSGAKARLHGTSRRVRKIYTPNLVPSAAVNVVVGTCGGAGVSGGGLFCGGAGDGEQAGIGCACIASATIIGPNQRRRIAMGRS
jgi:hypothetical protein